MRKIEPEVAAAALLFLRALRDGASPRLADRDEYKVRKACSGRGYARFTAISRGGRGWEITRSGRAALQRGSL